MPKKIMVVDDEPDNRTTVKTILEREGYEVVTAVNGDDCLKKLKADKVKPDLILMDIMMPGTPVRKVVEQITDIKIAYLSVVRTSEAEKEDLLKQKNIIGFLQKPFDVDEIIKKVAELVGNEKKSIAKKSKK
jgi:CheY-like chemotaxis protein